MRTRTRNAIWSVAVGLLALVGVGGSGATAVDAGTEPLQITVTDGGFWIRQDVAPGQHEVVIENLSGQDVVVELVLAPYGWTAEQLQLASEASTTAVIAGSAEAHSRGYGIVVLDAGTWLVRGAGQDGAYAAAFAVGSAS